MGSFLLTFGLGVAVGGLSLSVCWGIFWLVIGTIGLVRRTCRSRVVLNSLAVGTIPLVAIWALLWIGKGIQENRMAFALGLSIMPMISVGLGFRRAADGQRSGIRMLRGMRHLTEELLGQHHACARCGHQDGQYERGSG
jgi:hypothetical protein